jgi:hypothetical protein
MSHCGCVSGAAVLLLACLVSLPGCAPGAGATVSGRITLDGSPLDDATISFVPMADTQRQAGWATIEDGQYAIPASSGLGIGAFRVEIRALRTVGETVNQNDTTLPVYAEEALPSRYNSKSELVVNIGLGENIADFELKSK